MGSHAAREQHVAVGMRSRHPCASDCAAGAADILDHHGLTEGIGELGAHDSRYDVCLRARREWDHEPYLPVRIRPRVCTKQRRSRSEREFKSSRPQVCVAVSYSTYVAGILTSKQGASVYGHTASIRRRGSARGRFR